MKQNPDNKESPRDRAFKLISDHQRWGSSCSNHGISVNQVSGSDSWANQSPVETRGIYGFAWLGSKKDQTDSAAPSGGKTINIVVNDPTQTAREIWFTRTLNCFSFSIMVLANG